MNTLLLVYLFGATVTSVFCEWLDKRDAFDVAQVLTGKDVPKSVLKAIIIVLWPVCLLALAARK